MKDKLKSFFTEHWKYMTVSTACKLNLFDHLVLAKSASELAVNLSVNEDKLVLLMHALHNAGFLDRNGDLFKNNELSDLLTEDNPESLKYACLNWSSEHLNAWQNLDYSIKTGKSSFEKLYGKPFFDFLNENPDKLHDYHRAMYHYAKDDYKYLPDLVDLSTHQSVMDVGGGYGALLETVKSKKSSSECILFDLEEVVDKVYIPGIQKIGGSFFNKIPKQVEAIILSRVLHDWNDDKASLIVKNCFEALPDELGTLYVIENCSDKIKINLSELSLNMTAMCESYERTSVQYISLCENAGFHFSTTVKLNELQTILIFKK